jgi:hypothetical protein
MEGSSADAYELTLSAGNPTADRTITFPDSTGTVGFNGYIDLTWSSITAGDIRGYRIRYRPVSNPVSKYSYADSKGSGTSYRLHGLSIGAIYEIAVATYDQYNNLSSNYFAGNNVEIGGTPYIAKTVDVSGYFKAKANASGRMF